MRRLPNIDYKLAPKTIEGIPWFREMLLSWFAQHGRMFPWRESYRSSYEVLIAEILLQRTTAASVARRYLLFLERFPSWESLVSAPAVDLEDALRPVGLWKQKTGVLKALATSMQERGGQLPATRVELEQLPGVGQYIASAVLLVIHGQPEPLIDTNMARVLERFFGPRKLADIRDDSYLQTLARRVVKGDNCLEINWAILDFGALVCKPQWSLCHACPVAAKCQYFLGTVMP